MADQFTPTPVKTKTNGDVVAKIVDTGGTNVAGVDASNNLKVIAAANSGIDIGDVTVNNASGASAVNIQDGGNSITVDGTVTATNASVIVDDAAFTPASTSVTMVGATFDDTTPDTVNEGDGGAVRMSANRNMYTTILDAAGNERGLNIDASGNANVKAAANSGVDIGDVTINNASGASAVNIQDGGNSITVDGTVTATPTGTQDINIEQINTVDIATGNGVTGTGSQRVTVASDNTPFTVKVSKDASANSVSNAIFTTLTDGTAALGTGSNPLAVTFEGNLGGTLADTGQLTSAAVAAGATATLTATAVTTGTAKFLACHATSSVRIKVELQKFVSAAATTMRTFFVDANQSFTYSTPDRDAITFAGAAGNLFQLKITNMDNVLAADVYGSITQENI